MGVNHISFHRTGSSKKKRGRKFVRRKKAEEKVAKIANIKTKFIKIEFWKSG